MPVTLGPSRRYIIIALASFLAIYIFLSSLSANTSGVADHLNSAKEFLSQKSNSKDHVNNIAALRSDSIIVPPSILKGDAIAPKLGNETAKAELGRAAWKVLHTMMAKFPDAPTSDQQEALRNYLHLFQRLYPCGECATHFGQILAEFPPQVSSRSAAAAWACHVHNKVNESLKKEMFDCSKIGDFYDCGCADDDGKAGKDGKLGKGPGGPNP